MDLTGTKRMDGRCTAAQIAVTCPPPAVRASSWEPERDQAGLREANPLLQIPTLVLDDGTVLSESAAILIHLALAYPAAALLPADPSDRALALRGLVFIASNCYAAVSVSDHPERWTTSRAVTAREKVREAARAQLHRHWEIFADLFDRPRLLSPRNPGALAFLAVVVSQWSGARAHLERARPAFHQRLLQLERSRRLSAVLREHRGA
jgi:GST-like protein